MKPIEITLRCAHCSEAATARVEQMTNACNADYLTGYSPIQMTTNFEGAPRRAGFAKDFSVYVCPKCAKELLEFLRLEITSDDPSDLVPPVIARDGVLQEVGDAG